MFLPRIQQEVMNACLAQRNRRDISFLTWTIPRTTMTTMRTRTRTRKRSPPPARIRPSVPQTHTPRQEGIPAAVGVPIEAPRTLSPRASVPAKHKSSRRGGFGPTDEPLRRAAGERCSLGGGGRHRRGPSPLTVRAVPPAEASLPGLSCSHPATASPPGQSCPCPADTSHPPLREDPLPSDPSRLSVPFRPAAIGRPGLGPLPRLLGYSTGPLDTCHGRAPVQRVLMSN